MSLFCYEFITLYPGILVLKVPPLSTVLFDVFITALLFIIFFYYHETFSSKAALRNYSESFSSKAA